MEETLTSCMECERTVLRRKIKESRIRLKLTLDNSGNEEAV